LPVTNWLLVLMEPAVRNPSTDNVRTAANRDSHGLISTKEMNHRKTRPIDEGSLQRLPCDRSTIRVLQHESDDTTRDSGFKTDSHSRNAQRRPEFSHGLNTDEEWVIQDSGG